MRFGTPTTGNEVVRNFNNSDMDKIHRVSAEIETLKAIAAKLSVLERVDSMGEVLNEFDNFYPTLVSMKDVLLTLNDSLNLLSRIDINLDNLLEVEPLYQAVKNMYDETRLDTTTVSNIKNQLVALQDTIMTKEEEVLAVAEIVISDKDDITSMYQQITPMYNYIQSKISTVDQILSTLTTASNLATQIRNDKLSIDASVQCITDMTCCTRNLYNSICNISTEYKTQLDRLCACLCIMTTAANSISSITPMMSACKLYFDSVYTNTVAYSANAVKLSNCPHNTVFNISGCDGNYYSALHYACEAKAYAQSTGQAVGDINFHTEDYNNPHKVTKAQLGLGNVSNLAPGALDVRSASKLTTSRNINLVGAIVGSVTFDGTTDANIVTSLNVNFKTINGQSILGTGNISVSGGTGGSGTYDWNELINKPTTIGISGITDVYTKSQVDTNLSVKQDKLVSGTSIKTLYGQSILGGGDITPVTNWVDILSKPTTICGLGVTDVYTKTEIIPVINSRISTKVDKELNKGLSTYDFDLAYKTKLDNVSEYVHPTSTVTPGSYTKVTVDSKGHITAGSKPESIVDLGITDVYDKSIVDTKVATKVTSINGKGLSTNDFTNDLKTKLENLAAVSYLHPTSPIVPGDYIKVTVNSEGHVTAGSNPNSLAGYNITDAMSTSHIANSILGFGSSGASRYVAREDHTHASDSTKANIDQTMYLGTTPISINSISGSISSITGLDLVGNASTADKLKNLVKINNTEFDGSFDITITDSTKQPLNTGLTQISNISSGTGVLYRDYLGNWVVKYSSGVSIESVTGSGAIEITDGVNPIVSIKDATATESGAMSSTDKSKLDLIEPEANNYVHPDSLQVAGTYNKITTDSSGHVTSAQYVTNINALGITDVYTVDNMDALLADKQDKLISNTSIKTINGQSILGSGDISINDIATIDFTSVNNTPTTVNGYGITDVYTKTQIDTIAGAKQSSLISGSNIKTINGVSLLGSGDMIISPTSTWASITSKPTTISGYAISDAYTKTQVDNALSLKQNTLVSGLTIKTINGLNIVGAGDLTVTAAGVTWGAITGTLSNQSDLTTALGNKQDKLVSGTNLKTINGQSLLGTGDIGSAGTLDNISNVTVSSTTSNSGYLVRDNGADAWIESSEVYCNNTGHYINAPTKTISTSSSISITNNTQCMSNVTSDSTACYTYSVCLPITNTVSNQVICTDNRLVASRGNGCIQSMNILCSNSSHTETNYRSLNCSYTTNCFNVSTCHCTCTCGNISAYARVVNCQTYNYTTCGKITCEERHYLCNGDAFCSKCFSSGDATSLRYISSYIRTCTLGGNRVYTESKVLNGEVNLYSVVLSGNTSSSSYCCSTYYVDTGSYGLVCEIGGSRYSSFTCGYYLGGPSVDIEAGFKAIPNCTTIKYNCVDLICIPNPCCIQMGSVATFVTNSQGCGEAYVGTNIIMTSSCTKLAGLNRCSVDYTTNLVDSNINVIAQLGKLNLVSCQNSINIKSYDYVNIIAGYNNLSCTYIGGSIGVGCLGSASLTATCTGTATIESNKCIYLHSCTDMIFINAEGITNGCTVTCANISNRLISPINYICGTTKNSIVGNTYMESLVDLSTDCMSCSTTLNKMYKLANMVMIGNGCNFDNSCSTIQAIPNNAIMVYCTAGCNFVPRSTNEVLSALGLNSVIRNAYNASTGRGCITLTTQGILLDAYNFASVNGGVDNVYNAFSIYGNANTNFCTMSNYGDTAKVLFSTRGTSASHSEVINSYSSGACKNITLSSNCNCRASFTICGLPTTVATDTAEMWVDSKGYLKLGTCTVAPGLSITTCNITYTATDNQTSFILPLADSTLIHVFLNGLKLPSSYYSTTAGTLSFVVGISLNDVVDIDMIKIV